MCSSGEGGRAGGRGREGAANVVLKMQWQGGTSARKKTQSDGSRDWGNPGRRTLFGIIKIMPKDKELSITLLSS